MSAPKGLEPLAAFQGDVPVFLGFAFKSDAAEHGLWERLQELAEEPALAGGKVKVRRPASAAKVAERRGLYRDYRHVITNNPLVMDLRVEATPPGGAPLLLEGREGGPLFARVVRDARTGKDIDEDDPREPKSQRQKREDRVDYHGYLTKPVPAARLLELLRAQLAGAANPALRPRWRVEELFFAVDMFFLRMLMLMTDPAPGTNLADASNKRAQLLLREVEHEVTKGGPDDPTPEVVKITRWATLDHIVGPVEASAVQVLVSASPPGLPPLVKVLLELSFDTTKPFTGPVGASEAHKDVRSLIACEWSMLARHARRGDDEARKGMTPAALARLERVVSGMAENVALWLTTHTDLSKGLAMLDALVAKHQALPAADLSAKLREALDALLVIGNHWGQDEEGLAKERHQRVISDLLGTLYQGVALSSPVLMMRHLIEAKLNLTHRDAAALALQYGLGHCQEHANIAFEVLKGIKDAGSSQVTDVILAGYPNIDHAFVVFNLPIATQPKDGLSPTGIWLTRSTVNGRAVEAERNQIVLLKGDPNTVLSLWNLNAAVADERSHNKQHPEAPRTGRVLDPYLSATGRTAEDLLGALARLPPSHATNWLWVQFHEGRPMVLSADGKPFLDFRFNRIKGKPNDLDEKVVPAEDFFFNV